MQNDTTIAIGKAVPPVGGNFLYWLLAHDINWWVAMATLAYLGLQGYVLVRDKLLHRSKAVDDEAGLPGG